MSLPVCNVCGESPIYTVTAAGNHTLRCDGNPIGGEPRHTLYVWHRTKDGVEELWAKASRHDELADLRKKADDFSDGIYQMLVEAGASSDIDTMERQVSAAGTKPSHFVRKSFSELRGKLGEAWKELAELRAYRERTEAGLHKLSAMVDHCGDVTEGEMRVFGLWRDPPQSEVQP